MRKFTQVSADNEIYNFIIIYGSHLVGVIKQQNVLSFIINSGFSRRILQFNHIFFELNLFQMFLCKKFSFDA